jgi:hypothetical protein
MLVIEISPLFAWPTCCYSIWLYCCLSLIYVLYSHVLHGSGCALPSWMSGHSLRLSRRDGRNTGPAHHWWYNCLPEDLHALDFKPHVSTFDACLSCMSWSNMHVHMLPLHVRNEYACPHDTTPPCPDVKTHVWNLMFHNCMSNMHSEKNCMSTRYLFVKLHVHVAKCMSQNCHYANCMSNMQFKSELHVHKLKIFMMSDDG